MEKNNNNTFWKEYIKNTQREMKRNQNVIKSYWIQYVYMYESCNKETNKWDALSFCDSGEFQCAKKDMKKEVKKAVAEKLKDLQYKDLFVSIMEYQEICKTITFAVSDIKQ